MTRYAIAAPERPSVAIAGAEARFPVRRIFCVGRNYAEHVREMGNDEREPPFFFTKPADALVGDGATVPYPPATADLHHEAELVAAIGLGGAAIPEADALSHVWGYAPGNDLTRRDLQAEAKSMGRPWDMAKGFDASAVCGALVPAARLGHPAAGRILCTVNGAPRQDGDLSEMIWPLPAILAHLSRLVTLAPGDLIYTGTPAGVGPLAPGETCSVEIRGIGRVTTQIA
ncbi:fumarylpyruvate hydrolase [Rhodovulum sp. ES.010]|uniref:fumarylacetoacetate hydrolase family protein n=1 Tax=Rhodovulum sp. ES.010 TaxID=1882821 RepID=UPI000926CBE5|nr:fumarylacetoacetate hydrolase family protein [Rhodovulum sp. ES.010]SIO53138.1 fumarylpyruvate hydrolase [Rhodovulum sp. ES.010]